MTNTIFPELVATLEPRKATQRDTFLSTLTEYGVTPYSVTWHEITLTARRTVNGMPKNDVCVFTFDDWGNSTGMARRG